MLPLSGFEKVEVASGRNIKQRMMSSSSSSEPMSRMLSFLNGLDSDTMETGNELHEEQSIPSQVADITQSMDFLSLGRHFPSGSFSIRGISLEVPSQSHTKVALSAELCDELCSWSRSLWKADSNAENESVALSQLQSTLFQLEREFLLGTRSAFTIVDDSLTPIGSASTPRWRVSPSLFPSVHVFRHSSGTPIALLSRASKRFLDRLQELHVAAKFSNAYPVWNEDRLRARENRAASIGGSSFLRRLGSDVLILGRTAVHIVLYCILEHIAGLPSPRTAWPCVVSEEYFPGACRESVSLHWSSDLAQQTHTCRITGRFLLPSSAQRLAKHARQQLLRPNGTRLSSSTASSASSDNSSKLLAKVLAQAIRSTEQSYNHQAGQDQSQSQQQVTDLQAKAMTKLALLAQRKTQSSNTQSNPQRQPVGNSISSSGNSSTGSGATGLRNPFISVVAATRADDNDDTPESSSTSDKQQSNQRVKPSLSLLGKKRPLLAASASSASPSEQVPSTVSQKVTIHIQQSTLIFSLAPVFMSCALETLISPPSAATSPAASADKRFIAYSVMEPRTISWTHDASSSATSIGLSSFTDDDESSSNMWIIACSPARGGGRVYIDTAPPNHPKPQSQQQQDDDDDEEDGFTLLALNHYQPHVQSAVL